ncbi:MAG: helix-turn-helix domain-containing protein [Parcubacteria group bacterium]|jgi:sugar-specific transcriptional regulator TrmB
MEYNQLQDAGLNETEAKIYLAALELGQTSVSRIARKSGIKRTTIYLSLENLMQRGIMSAIKVSGRTEYYAEDPRNLERIMEERKQRISQLVPELLAFTNLIDKKPEVRYFDGEEGIKEAIKDNLRYPGQEICMMYSEAYSNDFDEKFFSDYCVPERIKNKIPVRAILPENEEMREMAKTNEKSLRQTRFIPQNLFNIQIEIAIYGNNTVSIISFKEKFALIIVSPIIYSSLKSIFETMWETSAKE